MAKHWMQEAFSRHPGAFKAKAAAAGKSTSEFASEHADSKGKLGAQARLAEIGMRYGKKGGKSRGAAQAKALR
jgi:hypothetical protein